jgi:ABC-type multidrug transport system permease subunit
MIVALINLIIWLVVVGIVYYLAIYVLDAVPVPDPPKRLIKILITVLLVLFIIQLLLGMVGINTGLEVPKLAP